MNIEKHERREVRDIFAYDKRIYLTVFQYNSTIIIVIIIIRIIILGAKVVKKMTCPIFFAKKCTFFDKTLAQLKKKH